MAVRITSTLKIVPSLEKLLKNHSEITSDAIDLGMGYIALEAPKKVKERITQLGLVKGGKLVKSIAGVAVASLDKAIIGSAKPTAHILERGAKPHGVPKRDEQEIKSRYRRRRRETRKKALMWAGATHPVKVIKHPGVKAYRFLEGTIENMGQSGELESLFARGVREAFERAGR